MNNRTVRVLGTIALILVAVYVITWISTARRTGKYLQDLAGQEPDKVMDALAALRERGGAVGPRLAELVRSGQAEAAPRAAWLLGMIGSHAGDAELLQAVQAQDPVLRTAAMQALGQLRAASAVQPLCTVLSNKAEKNEVRMAAAYALAAIGDPSATTTLVAALGERPAPAPLTPAAPPAPAAPAAPAAGAKPAAPAAAAPAAPPAPPPDTTIPLRIAVARSLGALRDPAAIDALVVATSDAEPDAEVRVAAAMALGDVASAAEDEKAASDAVTGLVAGLNDKVGDVRVACIHALGQTSPPEDMKATVAAAVNKAKDDDDYWARKAADQTAELLRLPE